MKESMYLFNMSSEIDLARERLRKLYKTDPRPWFATYSGGKDSTLLLQLICEVDEQEGKKKKIFVSFNDTCMEIGDKLERIKRDFERIERVCGFTTVLIRRPTKRSLLSLICGEGYPAPSFNMRYCTQELKVKPSLKKERELADQCDGLIIITGVRKQESVKRNKRLTDAGAPDALTRMRVKRKIDSFAPIANVKVCELWEYLKALKTFAWGGTLKELQELYDSEDSSLRDGCWVCTVCSEKTFNRKQTTDAQDKVRRFLREISQDVTARTPRSERQLAAYARGQAAGRFTFEARKRILEFILNVQRESRERLISDEGVECIREYLQTKAPYEFS